MIWCSALVTPSQVAQAEVPLTVLASFFAASSPWTKLAENRPKARNATNARIDLFMGLLPNNASRHSAGGGSREPPGQCPVGGERMKCLESDFLVSCNRRNRPFIPIIYARIIRGTVLP